MKKAKKVEKQMIIIYTFMNYITVPSLVERLVNQIGVICFERGVLNKIY